MLLMFLFYLPMQFVKILICDPISSFWSLQNPKCFDQHSIYLADTIVSVITDFAVLVIPMPLMWLLHLPMKRRLRVFGLLGAGGVAVAASVARLVMLLRSEGGDATVSTVDINLLGYAFSFPPPVSHSPLPVPNQNLTLRKTQSSRNIHRSNLRLPPRPQCPLLSLRNRTLLSKRLGQIENKYRC